MNERFEYFVTAKNSLKKIRIKNNNNKENYSKRIGQFENLVLKYFLAIT